ncbi:AlpA family transcriptional regulator [Ruegeria sp. HKCCD6604]|uniref:AlpA family phage regulatory protein n=2 Tax=Ruegeria atlantica TaxID=81569 RepID=A0ABX1W8F5_9RHOB|nr:MULTISPECIES: AlpA family transcriptional regulator [Ruegeria]NOC90613.1 AlpA family phage regulatory protein [Ruegeria sp. HKCCD6604]NOD29571.1 AlpA family phage regulatory protein [Ruegeria atlantica]
MQDKIYRRPDVESLVGLSRSTIYAMIADGSFPKPIKLGKRAVGWRQSDVLTWLDSRASEAV